MVSSPLERPTWGSGHQTTYRCDLGWTTWSELQHPEKSMTSRHSLRSCRLHAGHTARCVQAPKIHSGHQWHGWASLLGNTQWALSHTVPIRRQYQSVIYGREHQKISLLISVLSFPYSNWYPWISAMNHSNQLQTIGVFWRTSLKRSSQKWGWFRGTVLSLTLQLAKCTSYQSPL